MSEFWIEMKELVPKLRAHAMALTRDRDRAADLVQETLARAWARQAQFQPGTCLSAWLIRIQRNIFIDNIRRERPAAPLTDSICNSKSLPAWQEVGIVSREFLRVFERLPFVQREALVLAVVEGLPYEEIAESTGVSEGTVKSRISRGRDRLRNLLIGADEGAIEPASIDLRDRCLASGRVAERPA
jgi:RNA polymerase sigma-70 factor (ECF subfamily)